jgi:hypothetical protein
MKMFRLFFIGVFCLCRQNYWSQESAIHFEGTIYDEKNAVISGAQVQITKGGTPFNTIKSDENGNYNVYLPMNGEFNITVTKKGYAQKKYEVNTREIPKERSQIQFATNVADLVLFTKYDNVDYSLFEKPMNKYHYNPSNDNIIYDEAYLKEMKLAMKNFKNAQQEATLAAEEKAAGDKRIAENLAYEKAKADKAREKSKANENLALDKVKGDEKAANDKKEKEAFTAKKTMELSARTTKKNNAEPILIELKPDKTAVSMGVIKKEVVSQKTAELLAKYRSGVTEEIFQGNGVYVIQRVLVKNDMVWVYQKRVFNWGGVSCYRDKQAITEGIFEMETRKSS